VLKQRNKKSASVFDRAVSAVIEPLEERCMMYGDTTTVQALPYDLFFNANNGGVVDAHGAGTGFSSVEPNKNTNAATSFFPEYNNTLISETNPDGSFTGALALTTTGNATNGGPYEGDNTLVNGLQTTFDASTGAFSVTVRLQGPLSNLAAASEQGGLFFGPDEDNYIKLVAAAQPSPNNQVLQFIDETKSGSTYVHQIAPANTYTTIPNTTFASINTLDLRITGIPSTGTIIGSYRVNGVGPFVPLQQQFTYTGATAAMFFSTTAHAGITAMAKNNLTPIQVSFDSFSIDPFVSNDNPSINNITVNKATDGSVYTDSPIVLSVVLPTSGAGVDPNTLNSTKVPLVNTSTGAVVSAEYNTDGGGGVIVIHPNQTLSPNTIYQITVTNGVLDTNGDIFTQYQTTFKTGPLPQNPVNPTIAYQDVALANVDAENYTDVKFGPDGNLYASTLEGLIYRWNVSTTDGTLSNEAIFNTMQVNNGKAGVPREVTGFAFDTTAAILTMYVSNSAYGSYGAADFTGKITQLSGVNLQNYQDYVVGLPRSIKDHQIEQPSFGPDGNLYAGMASNTAMGAPDNAWGNRLEDYLSASILDINIKGIATRIANKQGPLNVQNAGPSGSGGYDPSAPGALLSMYATGVRNAYDILWVGNTMYAATNGSAANGNVPANKTGTVAGFTNPVIEPDMLYRIAQGGYYGHPDPARGEYILDGGNPNNGSGSTYTLSSGALAVRIPNYPLGTGADPNYRGTIDVLGNDNSADGLMIYHGTQFGGAIDNRLIVAQYSAPQDLSIITLPTTGNVPAGATITGVSGLENLNSPLSVTQYKNGTVPNDPLGGYMYVSEYGAEKLVLLKPIAAGAKISPSATTLYYTQPKGTQTASQTITITNTGTSLLTFGSGALSTIGGPNAGSFLFSPAASLPANLAPGGTVTLSVAFKPSSASATGIQTASFTITSNDTTNSNLIINLRGIATTGYGGNNEPSGQVIFDLLQIPDKTGSPNPAANLMPYPPVGADDEQQIKQFVKAGAGPVTLQTIALFTVTNGIRLGYYNSGDPSSKTQLLELAAGQQNNAGTQTVTPNMVGSSSFDPGSGDFSMYAEFPGFQNADKGTDRDSYQEDPLNTWDTTVAHQQKMRVYPLKNPDGSTVPNAYILIPEDFTTADDNDAVIIIRNVAPAPSGPVFGYINPDGNANSDVLTFSRQEFNQLPIPAPPNKGLKTPQVDHDTMTLQLVNSGNAPEIITSINLTSQLTGPIVNGSRTGSFSITNMPSLPMTIPANSSFGLALNFVAEGYLSGGHFDNANHGTVTGSIVVTTSTAVSKTFTLNGFWQNYPETLTTPAPPANPTADEPSIASTIAGMGYITKLGGDQDTGGSNKPIGDEIISPYWNLADTTRGVAVQQLQAYHTAGNTAALGWYLQGTTGNNVVLTSGGTDAQTVYPRTQIDPKTHVGDNPGFDVFSPSSTTTPFGFVIDNQEHSDDSLNTIRPNPATDVGHHMRFYPAIDENGVYIPNTYIMIMDYSGINFDFNDNAYLISNIRPSTGLAAPRNVAGTTDFAAGNTITWTPNIESTLSGYNISRSTTENFTSGTVTPLTPTKIAPSSSPSFIDTTATPNILYYYRITAVGAGTTSSFPTQLSLTRGNSTTIPSIPAITAIASGANSIEVDWSLSSGATQYVITRSTTGVAGSFSTVQTAGATSSQFIDSDLTSNQTYYYEVIAKNSAGSSQPGGPASATAVVGPSTPTGLTPTVNSGSQITLNWIAVSGATGYNILRSPDGSLGSYVPVNLTNILTTTYADTGLSPNTPYFYEVVATNPIGSSTASTAVTATTQQVIPAAPVATSATANGPSQITVLWQAVSNAATYIVQRSPSGLNSWTTITPVGGTAQLTFPDQGLNSTTAYDYQVFSMNTAGTSVLASNIVSATTTIAAPAAPAQPTVVAQSGTTINVSWTATPGAATYTIQRSPGGANTWTPIFTTLDNLTLSHPDQNLTPNTSYDYQIIANNAGGSSLPSATGSATTPQVQANTPGTLTATAVAASTTIALSWGSSSNAAGYTIQRSPDNGLNNDWQNVGTTSGVNSTTYTDNDPTLLSNTTYYYQIIATNTVASSLPSNISIATTVPAIPSPLSAVASSFVSINLSWSEVPGETGFSIERSANGTTGWSVLNTVAQGITSYQDSNLQPGSTFSYRVRAQSNSGFSDYTPIQSAATLGTSMLQDVGGGAFTDSLGNHWLADNPALWNGGTLSNSSVAIANTTDDLLYYTHRYGNMTYTLPADNGNYTLKLYFADTTATGVGQRTFNVSAQGVPVLTNFDVFKTAGAKTANIQTFNITISTGQLSVVFTTLVNNAIISAIQLIPNQPGQPATPTALTAAAVDSKTINLSWTNNATNDTGYKIERSIDQNNWTLINTAGANIVAGAPMTYQDANLKANTHYFYRVRATNSGLDSLNSNINSATTIVAAPTNIVATTGSANGINITWAAVTGALSYTVQRSLDGSTNWTLAGTPTTNSLSDSGLLISTPYFYRVTATVAAGTTSWSTNATAISGGSASIPTTPANETAVANSANQITVSWSGVTGAATYKVFRNQDDSSNWSLQNTITDTNLTSYSYLDNMVSPGMQYYYEVIAVNGAGPSPAPSPDPTATTPQLPLAPTGFGVTLTTTTEIDLSWNAVAGALSYAVSRSTTGLANSWTTLNSTVSSTTYQDMNLTPSSPYFYEITVTTAAGTSLPSTPAISSTTVPTSPTGLAITTVSSNEVDLTWNAVTGASSYLLESSLTGLPNSWSTVNTVTPSGGATESYPDTSVSALTQYFYRISVTTAGGPSTPSASVNTITAPATPTGLAFGAVSSGEIDLSWTAIPGVTNYLLQRSLTGTANSWSTIKTVIPSGNPIETYADQAVAASTTYFYRFAATISAGASAPTASISTATTIAPLLAPASLTATPVANTTTINLSWSSVATATAYILQRSTDNATWKTLTPAGGQAGTTYIDTDSTLVPNTIYFYQVMATNGTITSAATTGQATTPVIAPPAAFTISNVQATQVTLGWTESSTPITGFSIQVSTDNANWGTPIAVGNVNTTTITSLTPVQTYYFRISAINGPASSLFTTAGPINTPSAAAATTVIVDNKAATLVGAWTSSNLTPGFIGTDYLSDGNTGKTTLKSATFTPNLTAPGTYQVFARWIASSSRANNVPFDIVSASGTTTVVENQQLNNGVWISLGTFQFNGGTAGSVTIRNTAANGYVIADAVEFVPAAAPVAPAAPTVLNVSNIQSNQVTLTWSETSTAITGFTIQRSTDNIHWGNPVTVGNVTTTNITGLLSNQTYYFQIQANNGSASSGFTSAGPFNTLTTVATPTTVVVDNTAATTVGTWTASTLTPGFIGANYVSDGNTNKGNSSITFTPNLTAAGTYQVFARWIATSSRATNVPIDIVHQGTTTTVTANQQKNNAVWVLLGTFTFDAGATSSVTIRTTGTNGYVIADAVEFVPM
jgi:fibronectin type 3 domain-containing protein